MSEPKSFQEHIEGRLRGLSDTQIIMLFLFMNSQNPTPIGYENVLLELKKRSGFRFIGEQ